MARRRKRQPGRPRPWHVGPTKSRGRGLLVLGLVLTLSAAAVGWMVGRPSLEVPEVSATSEVPPMGPSEKASKPVPPRVPPAREADVVPVGRPVELRIPSVNVDTEVLVDRSESGPIDPPTFGEAYWLEMYGAPGTHAQNTVYLAGHSWAQGPAVFNELFDRSEQVPRISAGDVVELDLHGGTMVYRVDRVVRLAKEDLVAYERVWEAVPGRLVLITCFQEADGSSSRDNLVVTASAVE